VSGFSRVEFLFYLRLLQGMSAGPSSHSNRKSIYSEASLIPKLGEMRMRETSWGIAIVFPWEGGTSTSQGQILVSVETHKQKTII
jgi:hypothetical protein